MNRIPTANQPGTGRRPLLLRLAALVALLNLLACAALWISLRHSKNHRDEQAAVTTQNLSRVLDENLSGILAKVDIALQAVVDEGERQLASGAVRPETLGAFIARQHGRLPELVALRATDASGNAVYGPKTKAATTTSLAHRDYFQTLRDNPGAGLVISKPLVGGISGKWMVVLARPLRTPGGAFAGLVYAGLGLEYLTRSFRQLDVGARGTVTLLDRDLALVARYPAPKSAGAEYGRKLRSLPLLDLLAAGNPAGTYSAKSAIDDIERVFSYRKLSSAWPYTVVTGLATADYLKEWRAEALKASVALVLFCFGTTLIAFLFSSEWKKTRQAETTTDQSQKRFRAFVENASDLVYTLAPAGTITYVAPNVETLLGYVPDELVGKSFESLIHEEELPACKEFLALVVTSGVNQSGLEYRIRTKSGEWRWFLSNASLLIDPADGTPAFFGIGRDITDRKQAERALQAWNDQLEDRVLERTKLAEDAHAGLQAIIDCMSDWVWSVDAEGRYTYCSENVEPYLGYRPEEMVGRLLFDFVSAEDVSRVRAGYEVFSRSKRRIRNAENWCLAKDGRRVLFSINAVPVLDETGRLEGYRGVASDLTERRLAEEERNNALLFNRRILDSAQEGLVVYDRELRYQLWNPYMEKMTGLKAPDVLGKTPLELFPFLEESGVVDDLRRVLEGGHAAPREFQDTIPATGRRGWVVQANAPVLDGRGEIVGVLGMVRDVTEQRGAEEQFRQVQKMESIGRLAGGVAHDFNNMLGVILGHAELALMTLDAPSTVRADLVEIRNAAERSADLTRQLLAFARKQTIAPRPMNLNDTISGMLKMLQRLIGEDVRLTWQPAPDLWPIKADPSQIDQILANLCVNAKDAIADTGRITIETRNATIDAHYCEENGEASPGRYVHLAVSDDGCGMDRETRAHIFEPFYTTKELGQGTGLGLSTVFGIVKQNGGFLNVYSEPGQGTTFSLYLPRLDDEGGETPSEEADAPLPVGRETILLVEDEASILDIAATMLEGQGYTVLKATTSDEAARLAREHPGDLHLLLTDVVMPEKNGRDLADTLAADRPAMRRLFMSGYTANVIAHHGVLDEGVHFLHKPFSLRAVATKVREVLDE